MAGLDIFDHHASPAPAEPRRATGAGEPVVKDDKADSHKQAVIVLASVAAVVLAWFTYRKIANPTAASSTGTTVPTLGSGSVAGSSGTPDNSAIAGFSAYLNTIQNQLTALTDASAAGNGAPSTMLPAGGPDYSGTTGKILYDLKTATYGQVEANGSVDWLNNTQAAIIGATQANSSQVIDAGRLNSSNPNHTNLPAPATPAPATT